MCIVYGFEASDHMLRDIIRMNKPFGGKIVVFRGDFRQVLPIVKRESRGMILERFVTSSPLFQVSGVLHLTKNMRLEVQREMQGLEELDYDYPSSLLRVEERKEEVENRRINLPSYISVGGEIKTLIDEVFDGIETEDADREWLRARWVFATDNETVNQFNECVGNRVPGHYKTYLSADSVKADDSDEKARLQSEFPIQFLNSIEGPSSLPAHELRLKRGSITMLLRNLRIDDGHVNDSRYILEGMADRVHFLRSVVRSNYGSRLAVLRMNCVASEEDAPVPRFRKCQFPVRACFAMTVNKGQGQSVNGKLGLCLRKQVFSHGHLYVGLSRTTNPRNVTVYTTNGERAVTNIAFEEVLTNQ